MRFFVNPNTRMVRTMDDGDSAPPAPWVEVIAQGYDQFRNFSKIFFTSSNLKEARKVGNGQALFLKGIKRLANRQKKDTGCTLSEALDKVSQQAGFNNYIEASDALGESNG